MSVINVAKSEDGLTVLSLRHGLIEVSAYVTPDDWWMKIEHTDSDPVPGELQFASERVEVLADMIEHIRDAAEQEMLK